MIKLKLLADRRYASSQEVLAADIDSKRVNAGEPGSLCNIRHPGIS